MSSRNTKQQPRRSTLAIALAIGLGFTGVAIGQSTQGAIFGDAPNAIGQSVTVTSNTGTTRTVVVDSNGRYAANNLPAGIYSVTLNKGDEVVSTRNNVTIVVGGGTEVDFGTNATEMGTVEVNASQLPKVDVSDVSSSFTVTAAQLEKLPLGRNAEAIALLAPGVVDSSGYFKSSVTFAGAGATENAYYVNGFNTTSLYDYTGAAYQLPYGSIAQQQVQVGGYGAKFGRADGGVISQVGKRGTNEWHFGAQVTWAPRFLQANPDNTYYPNVKLLSGESYATSHRPGELHRYREANKSWSTTYSVYAGGPLIKDKLFMFVSVEQDKDSNRSNGSVDNGFDTYYKNRDLRWYGKLDWNINDSNILEYTKLKQSSKNGYGEAFVFDNVAKTDGDSAGPLSYDSYSNDTDIFHFTSYLSDAATLSILYGKTDVKNPILLPDPSTQPFISGSGSQNPALNGGSAIRNDNTTATAGDPESAQSSKGLRVDFEYRLGDHTLQAGIDNLTYTASNQGRTRTGPGYLWIYSKAPNGTDNINATLDVGAPGGQGYYVDKNIFSTVTSMSAEQNAWYVQDKWQVTPNFMLSLGIRNDDFSNSNIDGDAFVIQKDQWEPRLGFSWDVNGDSSLKIYGTAGRYYLALPQATGERAASGSVNTDEYFTYTGIDANGIPTGLSPVRTVDGSGTPGPVSANNEVGIAPDPETVTSTNLKPQYQDEYILGFDKTLGSDWVYGAKATYRHLGTVIDDECDPLRVRDKMTAMGLDTTQYLWDTPGCRIFNPNQTSNIKVNSVDGTSSVIVPMNQADFGGMPDVQREYYALDLYLEHPFDGKWMGRVSYTFARSWGNAEGQVRSDIGQTDVSVTEDWDYWQLMDHSRGYLANHRRHQIKAFGAYQITPEIMVSGTLRVQSGTPESCLGFFGTDYTNSQINNPGGGYGSDYHWCLGKPAAPGGEGTTPWTTKLDLGVAYRPDFADNKLAFSLNVFNVFDRQSGLQTEPHRFNRGNRSVNNLYHDFLFYQAPRSMRLSVSYDY